MPSIKHRAALSSRRASPVQQQRQRLSPLQLDSGHAGAPVTDYNHQPRFGQAPQLSTADPSPAMTIDNDSFSSMRPHIMGHPGARVYPVQQDVAGSGALSTAINSKARVVENAATGSRVVVTAQPNSDVQKYQQWRAATRSLGVTRDNALHNQLVLVNLPDLRLSQSRVDRLAVVRPSNDNVIVVGARDAEGTLSASVEAIYHVVEGASCARRIRSTDRPAHKPVRGYATLALGSTARTQDAAAPPPTRRARSTPDAPIHQATLYQRSAQMPSLMQTIEQRQRQHRQPNTPHDGTQSPKHGLSQIHVLPTARKTTSVAARPIAIPKSRLGKLQPAHRQMPRSAKVAAEGPVYHRDGSLVARRPDSIMVFADKPKSETSVSKLGSEPQVEVSDSYYDDLGYDLVNTEIDSLYCRSFDIDELPDAPERRTSCYNIRRKDRSPRSPSPEKASTPIDDTRSNSSTAKKRQSLGHNSDGPTEDVFVDALESPGNGSPRLVGVAEILSGIPSPVVAQERVQDPADIASSTPIASPKPISATNMPASDKNIMVVASADSNVATKPITREDDVDFYIRMLSLRSEVPAEELTPPVSPPSQASPHKQQQQQQSPLSAKVPLQPTPEQRVAGKQQRRRSQSSPMRPTIHRHQQDPVYLGNFWPNGAATFQNEADNIGSRAKCHGPQAGCHSLLPRVSLSSRLFSAGKTKDTPGEADIRHATENQFNEKSHYNAATVVNLTAIDTRRVRGCSAPAEYTLRPGTGQLYRDIERENATRRNHSLNNRSNNQRPAIDYVPRAGKANGSDAVSRFRKKRSSVLATATVDKEADSRQQTAPYNAPDPDHLGPESTPQAIHDEFRRNSLTSQSGTGKDVDTKPSKYICHSPRWPLRLRWPRSATEDASTTSIYSAYGVETQRTPYLSHVFNGSWAHIFRSQQAGLAVDQPQRRRRRRERFGDACAYPFHLTYNCLLWWMGPCIDLARECRAMCSTR
ncbi:hypothetical protein H4R24_004183 [Coemansia sp. RSA 988]|nr:hypothetical protein H4R24_004183 [Coemansia sp. RSA 988]